MATTTSPFQHIARNLLLILTSLFFLPISTYLLITSYCLQILVPQNGSRRRVRRSPHFKQRTVLVTGVGLAKGLKMARSFYEAGHDVIGADFEADGVWVCGRFSKALRKFYKLAPLSEEGKKPAKGGVARYISDLVRIVEKEHVDLWVPCSDVTSAVEDAMAKEVLERRTPCKCIQFDVATTKMLDEKDSFIRFVAERGLPVPEMHDVTSRTEVHKVLGSAHPRKKYIMRNAGEDAKSRANMTLLPRRTLSETYQHVSCLKISKESPWVLQQFIQGQEYFTYALVIRGDVKAFVACESVELLMHYRALPEGSGLGKAMLNFTQEVAEKMGDGFTGHLSFGFMVEETARETGVELRILPFECTPKPHTAVVLFGGKSLEMVDGYLEALRSGHVSNGDGNETNGYPDSRIVMPSTASVEGYYFLGHDLISLVLHPFTRLLRWKQSLLAFLTGIVTFIRHVFFWKDGHYEVWDPLPAWWLYHGYWPGGFALALLKGRRWNTVDVSTGEGLKR
jgi:catechol O-methyltransferase